jgi:hypothetical protein
MNNSFALDYRELEKNHWWFRARPIVWTHFYEVASLQRLL